MKLKLTIHLYCTDQQTKANPKRNIYVNIPTPTNIPKTNDKGKNTQDNRQSTHIIFTRRKPKHTHN